MRGNMIRKLALFGCAALLVSLTAGLFMVAEAEARAGGGSRSMGSRGSRSYSQPASPSTSPSPYQAAPQQARPMTPPPYQQPQPAGGGFMRSMAGGLVGGMLGGMLFRSMGFGGGGGMGGGGGGIGLFEILLLAGIGYFIYRYIKSKRQQEQQGEYTSYNSIPNTYDVTPQQAQLSTQDDLDRGLSHIRQMDAGFSEERFTDQVMDMFFKVQGAWMNRDLSPVNAIITDEMRRIFQEDLDRLIREKKVNRLENIAVRTVEISEAWQEQGQDYITALIYANLLDYTTDDVSGQVVSGSKTDPVKFEEFWTFTRSVGTGVWKLSGINQK
ncbi:MAG: Tim44 domain-containing protein [Geobacteraceae bacterium]|nr:Tim44 domain-containing protein [Geobacteraceae bacterium]